jgi:hypothetical protein
METHRVDVTILQAPPAEVPVGAELRFTLVARCATGCDLAGAVVEIISGDAIIASGQIGALAADTGLNEPATLVAKAPSSLGAHTWRVQCPSLTHGGALHEAIPVDVAFDTVPCRTSLAVWGIPPMVLPGERFTIHVGAKSASNHPLSGGTVELFDESGARVAAGIIGDTPWPQTTALYWAAIELVAPSSDGVWSRSVTFTPALDAAHHRSSSSFTFTTARAPEHTVTVQLTQKENGKPIADAQVRLGAYGAATDASGRAIVEVPKGVYDVFVWKSGYLVPRVTVDLGEDRHLQFVGEVIHRDDPWTQLI